MAPVPGQPHPDVAILVNVIKSAEPGATIPRQTACKAINSHDEQIVYRRMRAARLTAVRDHGINTVAIPGIGWRRETDEEATARFAGREIRGIRRKSRKLGVQMSAVDTGKLNPDVRATYFSVRMVNNLTYLATSPATKKKVLEAAKASNAMTPMAGLIKLLGG